MLSLLKKIKIIIIIIIKEQGLTHRGGTLLPTPVGFLYISTHTHTVNELYNTHAQMFPRRTDLAETAALLQLDL